MTGRTLAHTAACAFAARHGAEDGSHFVAPSLEHGSYRISAVDTPERPTDGKWKRGPGECGWAPYKNNPLSAEMAAIRFDPDPIPGLPTLTKSDNRLAATVWFLHEDTAWANLIIPDGRIVSGTLDLETYGWTEVLGTEYRQAADAYTNTPT
jgi:hypothetical protein